MARGVSPGWYPDYDAPQGHERYWDGAGWTERRAGRPPPSAPATSTGGRLSGWIAGGVCAVVACLVIAGAAVLVVGDDQSASSGTDGPPPASTPGPPASEDSTVSPSGGPDRRTWEVAEVLDGATFQLANGATVRLVGVTVDDCATTALTRLVKGQRVTLTRRGTDKDSEGLLLRYAELGSVDVGLRLIQRGLATASDTPHPRRAIYQRVDDRSPDVCG